MKIYSLLIFLIFNLIILGEEKVKITTTILPNSLLIKEVAGDKGEVTTLIPPGSDIHHYEPTPKDVVALTKNDIFFYTNNTLEPWVEKISSKLPKSLTIEKLTEEGDPHRWLDPIEAQNMLLKIENSLDKKKPEVIEYFSENRKKFSKKLQELHEEYSKTLAPYRGKSLIYIGHHTFDQLGKRYDINFLTPYKTTSTDSEPTPQDIIKVVNYIKENKIKYIFYEQGEDPRMVNLIAKETGAQPVPLNPLHTVSGEYIPVMKENLNKIVKGLKNEPNSD